MLAPLASLALCAVLTSAASAEFESEAASTTLSVSSNAMQSFKTSAGSEATIECTTFSVDNATMAGTATTELTIEPTYGSCEDFFGQDVAIDENGCDDRLVLGGASTEGSIDLECPSATGVEITVGNLCRYEIDSQTSLGTVKYNTVGSSSTREIEMHHSVTGISIVRTTNDFPFTCPNGTNNGTYTGTSRVTGQNFFGHAALFVD